MNLVAHLSARGNILVSIVAALVLLAPAVAFGQFDLGAAGSVGLRGGLVDLLAGIIRAGLLLVGVVALGFMVYGGFLYITARGDESQVASAKKTITYAVFGIIVIGLAYALVTFVINAVGGSGGGGAQR